MKNPPNQRTTKYGIRTYVKVHGLPQKEKHWKHPSSAKDRADWIVKTRAELKKKLEELGGRPATRGSFNEDAISYLRLVKPTLDPATFRSRVCEIDAWRDVFAREPRSAITRDRVLDVRRTWLTEHAGKRTGTTLSTKTVINREGALRHLFHVLDGKRAPTPLDDLPTLKRAESQPRAVSPQRLRLVAKRLADPQTRARFMVLASTGQRPAQLKRAQPEDVDLRRKLWLVRPAKGGNRIPVTLTDDMIAAWKAFKSAEAWGHFDGSDFAKELYEAGWPKDIPPYHLKHSMAITLAEGGADWEDIKDWFGHTDVKSTRIYTGFVRARSKALSATLAGRIGW